jgi:hypothetical protein
LYIYEKFKNKGMLFALNFFDQGIQIINLKFFTMKKFLSSALILSLVFMAVSFTASAQIYVTVRPPAPVIVRPAAPSPAHVWIGDEWEERGGKYVYVGGHWDAPPRRGQIWVAGFWKREGHHGERWIKGHWARR